jgi:hypothetical protein
LKIPTKTRRMLILGFMGLGLLGLVLAAAATVLAFDNAATWLLAALVIVAISVAAELVLLVVGEQEAFDASGEWHDWEQESQTAGGELVLRCPACGDTFNMVDDGARPLRGTCPHCGAGGVLQGVPSVTATKR